MNEQEFKDASEKTLLAVEAALEIASENSATELDFEWQGDGVLEISFADHSKIIINRHSSAQEIWVAARSGGFHFKPDSGQWIDTRDGQSLLLKLSELLTQQAGENISLSF